MGHWIAAPVAGLIEPAIAPEFYSNAEPAIELLNTGDVRFWIIGTQLGLDGLPQHVVLARIIKPVSLIPSLLVKVSHVIARTQQRLPVEAVRVSGPRLVT